jgi:uncharacterized integral membrane protein
MRNVYFIAGIALGLSIALFALQNGTPVSVSFLAWKLDGPLAGVVLGSAAAGALLLLLFGLPSHLALRWRLRALERELTALRPKPPRPEDSERPKAPLPPRPGV